MEYDDTLLILVAAINPQIAISWLGGHILEGTNFDETLLIHIWLQKIPGFPGVTISAASAVRLQNADGIVPSKYISMSIYISNNEIMSNLKVYYWTY